MFWQTFSPFGDAGSYKHSIMSCHVSKFHHKVFILAKTYNKATCNLV